MLTGPLKSGGASGKGLSPWPAANLISAQADPSKSLPSATATSGRASEIEAFLKLARVRAQTSQSNVPPGTPRQEVLLRGTLLQRLPRLYQQQLSTLADLETAEARRAEVAREVQEWAGFSSPPPYSILLTDSIREQLQAERLRAPADEKAIQTLNDLISEHRNALNQAEERIRQLNEQMETAMASPLAPALKWQRELEQIRSQVAGAAVGLLGLERNLREQSAAASRLRLQLLQRQYLLARANTQFTQADLERVLSQIAAERGQMESALAKSEQEHVTALDALDAGPPALQDGPALAAERREVRSAQADTASTAVRALRLQLEAVSIEQSLWELRFVAYGSRQVETLRQSFRQLNSLTRRVALWKSYFREKLEVSSSEVLLQESRVNSLEAGASLLPMARQHLAALQERDAWLLNTQRRVAALERLLERWSEDLQNDLGKLPLSARARTLFSNTRASLRNLWGFELFSAEDTITVDGQKVSGRRSVTIGKAVTAVFILLVGYWVTGLVARAGRDLTQRWFRTEPQQGELLRRWLRAGMVVLLIMFSLVSVKIPLTVFAFAGGALAIGVGFGTQTVLKNVVSGLIILFERPFRVGDVLDVAGQRGTLTSIGLRACVLQLWDGTETLFPNSALLENALTNWTYSNRIVRFALTVGVAYGCDTRRVTRLLDEVLARHGQIEPQPKPQVFFTDFGPSSLSFEVRYWLDVLKTNAAQVASDLRHMIAGAFAEQNIVIAFPQQDVHFDEVRPIRVQLVPVPDLASASNGARTREAASPDFVSI